MNKQAQNGKRGIEWTDYTWNPVGGCKHGCRWKMPDGTIAVCYAESTANTMTRAYPEGFEHHYWRPHMLPDPKKIKEPCKIFCDSMSDLMGQWVPDDQIEQVFNAMLETPQHSFQLLTKNAPRLAKFTLPPHLWVGVSAPPTFMFGKELTPDQQRRMVMKQLGVLSQLSSPIRWMSIEPLSFDIAAVFSEWCETTRRVLPLEWAVIGAASRGSHYFQPNRDYVHKAHDLLGAYNVKIFHKGNLEWTPHLEEFPVL